MLGYTGAIGVSARIMVSMNQFVVVTAEVLATVGAELCSRFTAPLLMLLQLIRTPESTDVANLYFLTCLQWRIQSDTLAGNRFDDSRMRSLCRDARMSLVL